MVTAVLAMGALIGGAGCESTPAPNRAIAASAPVFTGESYLHGSVGSLCSLRQFEPLLVSGFGVVVLPPGTGTGSADVPSHMRQWLINEMRRKGLGQYNLGTEELTPRKLLATRDVAVVRVEGLIPPGATVGTTFHLLVTALENTQTTSLEGGTLWTTDLAAGGDNLSTQFRRPLAEGKGAVFISPFDDRATDEQKLEFRRQAVVLAGGVVSKDRQIELVLNQPSWARSRLIADRINERFPHQKASEFFNTAEAKTDALVRLNVPSRFANDPSKLIKLISHLYLDRASGMEDRRAKMLGDVLTRRKEQAADVCEAWQSLGKLALPVIREYYRHELAYVRMTSLEAGAWLQDELAAGELASMALSEQPQDRRRSAELLGRLVKSTRAARALHSLVDDPDRSVRIAAYEALAEMGDLAVDRRPIGDRDGFKFFLDVVRAKEPLIYISQREVPRLVVFSPNTGFKEYVNAALWEGRLRLRGGTGAEPINVFFQPAQDAKGKVQQIAPTVANFALVMAHRPTAALPVEGFDLSYSSVVNALFNLKQSGDVLAEMEVVKNPLAEAIEQMRNRRETELRPEVGPADDAAAKAPAKGQPREPLSIDDDEIVRPATRPITDIDEPSQVTRP